MWHTAPAHGTSGQPLPAVARSQRLSDPDAANRLSYVKRRVVSHCIAPRPRLSSPTGSCQLHIAHCALHSSWTIYIAHRTVLFSLRCVSATSGHLCSHPDPLRLPGFQGFTSGGRCCGTHLPPSSPLVGRYLVAAHLKHATNRLLFICANRACRAA